MWIRFRKKSLLISTLVLSGVVVLLIFVLSSGSDHDDAHLGKYSPSSQFRKRSRDIHVVIGYYQGGDPPWMTQGTNLTDEVINANMYAPDPLAGRDGEPVLLPPHEGAKVSRLFQINRFNLLASDRIPVNRTLPDVRRKECKKLKYYPQELPSTSIIIVFHNEAWSTLLRTIHSVLSPERSPLHLIKDVILVDDASQRTFLSVESLTNATRELSSSTSVPIKVLRSGDRVGLIRARLLGAKEAEGEVLTFLDAHCEATKGWLEPLLHRIHLDQKAIVSPVIDIINDDTFQYVRSFEMHQGGFNWDLHFRWFSLPPDLIQKRKDPTEPLETPVMAGGLFSVDKRFFFHIGSYDEGMDVWGGENLEISFRTWMCGGRLEIAPCSHVGHLFRKSSPYTFPSGISQTLNSNLARVALVWLDGWKNFYFRLHPEVKEHANQTAVASRLALRQSLGGCHNFKWYLDTVWPHHFLPTKESQFFGKIRNLKAYKCLQSPTRTKSFGQPYGQASLSDCILELYASQLFILTSQGYIKTDDNVCLDAVEFFKNKPIQVRIMACNNLGRQKWTYDATTKNLKHTVSKKCLDLADKGVGLELRPCIDGSLSQQWALEEVEWGGETNKIL